MLLARIMIEKKLNKTLSLSTREQIAHEEPFSP